MPAILDASHASEVRLDACRRMPFPSRLVMCSPDFFDVIDVKNPHMDGHVGGVDRDRAHQQWDALRRAYESAGVAVDVVPGAAGCEDMVFTANPFVSGLNADNTPVVVLSNMTHAARRPEVEAFAGFFDQRSHVTEYVPQDLRFEGGGDALWHPGRGLLWGGYGWRSDPAAYETLQSVYDVPVIRLRLVSDKFYHLDTCFSALDEQTVLITPEAFEPTGVDAVRSVFERVLECPADEAVDFLACNGTALNGRIVITEQRAERTVALLSDAGFDVRGVDLSEYRKSGGSAFCMKGYVFE